MAVRIVFKRILPSLLFYYAALQGYLVYHLKYSEKKVRLPNLPEIKPRSPRKTLVENIMAIYQCKAVSKNFVTFTEDLVFEDPTILTMGKKDVMNIAYIMRALITKSETVSLKEYHFEDRFIIEFRQKYTFLGRVFELPSVLYVDLEGKGDDQKVRQLEEEWFSKSLITPGNTRFLFTGISSHFLKRMHAKLLNLFTFDEPK